MSMLFLRWESGVNKTLGPDKSWHLQRGGVGWLVLRLSLRPCLQFHPHSNGFSNSCRKGSGSSPLKNGDRRGRAGKFRYVRLLFESLHIPRGRKWGRYKCLWDFWGMFMSHPSTLLIHSLPMSPRPIKFLWIFLPDALLVPPSAPPSGYFRRLGRMGRLFQGK